MNHPATSRRLIALLILGSAALALLWCLAGNLLLRDDAYQQVALLRSLVVDRDLDLFTESGPMRPGDGGTPDAAVPWVVTASLLAPMFSVAHLVSAFTAVWAPDGANPFYGLMVALTCLAAVVLGLALMARMLFRNGATVSGAALPVFAFALASPLVMELLRAPAPEEALSFLLVAALVAARATGRAPVSLTVVAGVAIAAVSPRASGWLVLLLADLVTPRGAEQAPPDEEAPFFTVLVVALLVVPQFLVWGLRDGSPLIAPRSLLAAAFSLNVLHFVEVLINFTHPVVLLGLAGLALLSWRDARWRAVWLPVLLCAASARPGQALPAVLAPPLIAGLAELHAIASRRRVLLASVLVVLVLVAGNVSLEVARRAGVQTATPWAALSWMREAPVLHLEAALLPADRSLPPWLLAQYLGLPLWSPALLAGCVALLAVWVAHRRMRSAPLMAYLGVSCSAVIVVVMMTTTAPQAVYRTSFVGSGAILDFLAPTHVLYPPAGTWATRLEVVTSLDRDPGAPIGDLVARILVRDVNGREFEWPLVAGMDTGIEPVSLGAPIVAAQGTGPGRKAYSILLTRVARYAVTGQSVTQPTIGETYRRTCELPFRMQVAEVRVERRHPQVRLNVCGVWLADPVRRIAPLLAR